MRTLRPLFVALAFAVSATAASSAFVSPAAADNAPAAPVASVASMSGHFVYNGSPQEEIGRKAAIDRAVDSLFFAIRPIARWRLSNGTRIVPWISFAIDNGIVRARGPEGLDLSSPENGTPTRYTFRGEKCNVSQFLRDKGSLVQTYIAEDGTGRNEWTLSPDGSLLLLKVTITSPRLPKPMVYSLTYKRTG